MQRRLFFHQKTIVTQASPIAPRKRVTLNIEPLLWTNTDERCIATRSGGAHGGHLY